MSKRNIISATIIAVVSGIIFLIGATILRVPEDDWICVGGQWIKHGNPNGPMPGEVCNNN